ncbi:MAG: transcription termination/antitermination protein NusG [Mycoplasmoidaceae bacterium]
MENIKKERWYIATTIIGSEEKIKEALQEKIRAYKFEKEVVEMKIIKHREIRIEEYNDTSNPPPKSMRNSKNIRWETTPNGYDKIISKEVYRFPGYLFINMIMTQEIWYMIRNTAGITGFVGSSGKGARPIPISEDELIDIFNENNIKDKIIRVSKNKVIEEEINIINTDSNLQKEVIDVEYFNSKASVSQSQINNVKKQISLNGNEEIIKEKDDLEEKVVDENYQVGNELIIINGVLIGSTGIVKKVDNLSKIVTLEVEILGNNSLIELPFKDVCK